MSELKRLIKEAEHHKEQYPVGTRIYLNNMNDPYAPVPSGTRGTVDFVDDIGQLHMMWDNGRTLALIPGVDSFRKLTEKELDEEKQSLSNIIKSAEAKVSEGQNSSMNKNYER